MELTFLVGELDHVLEIVSEINNVIPRGTTCEEGSQLCGGVGLLGCRKGQNSVRRIPVQSGSR